MPVPPRKSHRKPVSRRNTASSGDQPLILFGLHAVAAALANPARPITRLLASENAARKLKDAFAVRGVTPEILPPKKLDRLVPPDTVHQGILLFTEPLPESDLEAIVETAVATRSPIVVLDQVTDPHNVGAILRSAAVFGVAGLIMTRRHSPPLTGTLAKSASGALEHIHVCLVQNLNKTLISLKDQGVVVLGLAGDSAHSIEQELFSAPTALVLGAEGKGLRQSAKENCDRLVRISARGALASLNVSNAAAIALHVAAQKLSQPV